MLGKRETPPSIEPLKEADKEDDLIAENLKERLKKLKDKADKL